MSKKITFLALTLIIALFSGLTAQVCAVDDNNVSPVEESQYVGINEMQPSVTISSGTATCTDRVRLKSGYTATVTWVLQQGKSGTWSNYATWTKSGTNPLSLSVSGPVIYGYSYRLKVTINVYDANGKLVETIVKYSAEISYP